MRVPDPLFVACVQDNATWWFERGYAPKNGIAGVRAKQYAMFRDHVILDALRIFRARTEGLPLDSVPPVIYSMKPSTDGRINGGQRGIVGFERCKVVISELYVDEQPLPVDVEQILLPDSKADALAAALEELYHEALAGLRARPVARVKRKRKASSGPPVKRRSLLEYTAGGAIHCDHR